MGNKIHPVAVRLGINKDWQSVWFAGKKDFKYLLQQDLEIRAYLRKELRVAGLDTVEIKRPTGKAVVTVYVARPGVAVGRKGVKIETMKKKLQTITHENVDLRIKEVKNPDLSANIVASSIAIGVSKRQSPKILAKNAMNKVMSSGAKGIMIWIAGRIRGVKDARTLKFVKGTVPLQSLRANIDYATERAPYPSAGIIGIKVWIYK